MTLPTYHYDKREDGCTLGCLATTIWVIAIALNFAFWAGLIWLAIHLLQQAGAF